MRRQGSGSPLADPPRRGARESVWVMNDTVLLEPGELAGDKDTLPYFRKWVQKFPIRLPSHVAQFSEDFPPRSRRALPPRTWEAETPHSASFQRCPVSAVAPSRVDPPHARSVQYRRPGAGRPHSLYSCSTEHGASCEPVFVVLADASPNRAAPWTLRLGCALVFSGR